MDAKARLGVLSQSSQRPSIGTPGNITPATRRKSVLIVADSPKGSPNISIFGANDDQNEKKRRLQARLSDVAMKHLGSPASESRNKPLGSTLSGWNDSQMAEHLNNCIMLSKNNKINARNAFALHLIDNMTATVKKEKETNFQMAGSSVEAGAKIYASRVDAVHIQAFQVLDQVSQLDKDGDRATIGQAEGDTTQGDDPEAKRKTVKKKKKKLIETDLSRINTTDVKQSYQVDPLLQKLSKEGDSSFGGILLDCLKYSHDNGGLMLDVLSHTEPPTQFTLSNSIFTDCGSQSLELLEKDTCPTFKQYEFNSAGTASIFTMNEDDELRYDPNKEVAIHNDDDDYMGDGGFADADDMDGEAGNAHEVTDFVDYIGKTTNSNTATATTLRNDDNSTLLSLVSGRYTFLTSGMKRMWAGPGYWKGRRAPGNKRSAGEQLKSSKSRKTARQQLLIDFEDERDFEKNFKVKSKNLLRNRSNIPIDLPEKSDYKRSIPPCLFSIPTAVVTSGMLSSSIVEDEPLNKSASYDYFNKTDVDNFCPDISEGMGDDNDDNYDSQVSLLSGQPMVLDFDDTLIAQPAMVERINLLYAKRPKKVDFKRLKRHMWNILTESPNEKENVEQNTADVVDECVKKDGMPFTDVYSKLPVQCPYPLIRDLSPSIAFVALLHMCNEKNLLLKENNLFADLTISDGEK